MEKSMSRAILCALLTLSILLTLALPALADEPGEPSSWAAAPVETAIYLKMVPQELQGGYQTDMTRGEFAKMAVWFLAVQHDYPTFWADGVLDDATAAEFIDYFLTQSKEGDRPRYQKSDYWGDLPEALRKGKKAEDYTWRELLEAMTPFAESTDPAYADDRLFIHAAYVLGIVNGRDDGTFDPDGPITRQEAAAMLFRAYKLYNSNRIRLEDPDIVEGYADAGEIGSWAQDAVAFLANYQVMEGVGGGMFSPLSHYTREQCIVTFYRLYSDAPTSKLKENVHYLSYMETKMGPIYHNGSLKVYQNLKTEDAIILVAGVYRGTMQGWSGGNIYILYRSEDKEDLTVPGVRCALSEDKQYVTYTNEEGKPCRIHIATGQIEEV